MNIGYLANNSSMRLGSSLDHQIAWPTMGKLEAREVGLTSLDILNLGTLAGLWSSNSGGEGAMG